MFKIMVPLFIGYPELNRQPKPDPTGRIQVWLLWPTAIEDLQATTLLKILKHLFSRYLH